MRDDLKALTPRLRRYARALVSGSAGPCDVADSLVHATLMRAIGTRGGGSLAEMPIRLFATVTQLHRDLAPAARPPSVAAARSTTAAFARDLSPSRKPVPSHDQDLAATLLRLPVEEREALLLVVLERFDHPTAARILRISRPVLFERLTRARRGLGTLGETMASGARASAGVSSSAASSAGESSAGKSSATLPPTASKVPYLRLVVG